MLPESRHFKLPESFAWFANLLGVAYVIVTTVLFVFPPELPVTGSNMNYCVVAFAVVLLISVAQWFIDGRKNYRGPRVEVDDHVLVAAPTLDGPPLPGSATSDFSEKEKPITGNRSAANKV
jgi:choline transport protein